MLQGCKDADYILTGFRDGFHLNFEGAECPLSSRNSQTVTDMSHIAHDKIQKELASGRISGPYNSPPLKNFKSSPLSLRPKKDPGKFRLLHNLSFPYDGRSVNRNIPRDKATVKYATLGDAISLIQSSGTASFLAKSDIADAFGLIPLHPSQYHLTGFTFQGQYYYDRCLPMGCSSSCHIFERFSDALVWVLRQKFHVTNIVKVLDDFLFVHSNIHECQRSLSSFQELCMRVGVPISVEKTVQPTTCLTFLGVQLDTARMQVELPQDKLSLYSEAVASASQRKKITLSDLKSLIGKLQFATIAIPHGRAFLRRLHDLTIGIQKPFYFIRFSNVARADLSTWHEFLQNYACKTIIREIPDTDSRVIHMFADASSWGYGATYGTSWLQGKWPADWQQLNIAILELYPVFLLVTLFAEKLRNSKIVFHSDNQAVVAVLNSQTSKCSKMMAIIRKLVLCLLLNHINLRAKHIPGCNNIICDFLSRQQATESFLRRSGMSSTSVRVPVHLLPDNFSFT